MKPHVKYAAIFANKEKYSICELCRYFQVSRSGYYDWQKQKDNPDKDEELGRLIRECQRQTKQTYGYRRVKLWLLRKAGIVVNSKAVLRVMNKYGLLAEIRRPRPLHLRQQKLTVYENKLNRDFTSIAPNKKWVSDISYIHTKEGTLYLCVIKDLFDNYIVSFEMGTIQDTALVYRAVKRAKKEVADGLSLHSDQGSPYTSLVYRNLTKRYGILPSMSRPGNPIDNAPAENFFGILKVECVYRHKFHSIKQAKAIIKEYIHFYNFERIQLKYGLTPFEKRSQTA